MKIRTLFLKSVLIGVSIIVLLFAIFIFPHIPSVVHQAYPSITWERFVFSGSLYGSALCFYTAAVYAWRILSLIDQHAVFSGQTLKALTAIKYLTSGMGCCYLLLLPMVYHIARITNAPKMPLMVLAVALVPFICAVVAAILKNLFKQAITMKLENQRII
ncbi:hypothetical protein FC83_GL000992 [Agrilactobacillus composti DSM 18527 = JCM 14202]|uniref:DUF2975 domain-containing protein n=1 Tax=Agrilactobacillus composti DSM 18527 = JCM 14202 TaxID=1423734 RepID=X0PUF6_9LACO|nr:DUF2975 domain-containing protein [Agrilactobacillus composti]KRM35468.1 hypothetical protein FC83_GL000992 [Agrilactobacillus composti DSM 18527 = JCM 14202]GAF40991.1 putative membrane protein [Agrilactobacillus composti DSM 18527 = JCM 14202]